MRPEKAYIKRVMDKINAGKRVSPLHAIRANCLDCQGFSSIGVKNCEIEYCPLRKFRFGKNMTAGGRAKFISNLKRSPSQRACENEK